MIIPPPLRKGAVIGIVSPASPQRDASRLDRGIRYLESLGYRVELAPHARSEWAGYLAGTDDERLSDIHAMVANPSIDAIFCARGGYGSARLLDRLHWKLFARNPKILVGFSDITALQLALWSKVRLVTFSGALPSVDMADEFDAESEASFWRILTSRKPYRLHQSLDLRPLQKGTAHGSLLGGNLSILTTLFGTSYLPSLKGALLAIEDVGEEPYRIDRMLNHVRLATQRSPIAGMLYGQFSQSTLRPTNNPARSIDEIIAEHSATVMGPACANLMYGHEAKKLTLPIGAPATMEVGRIVKIRLWG
jgi:muramoyltetrapeptide carboxypeptidase